MFGVLLRFFMVLTICHTYNVSASYKHSEEDLELSKRTLLISGALPDNLFQEKKGVVTLCFKDQKSKYEHSALVFEMLIPEKHDEISLRMIHFGGLDGCCGGGRTDVIIESEIDTLKKSYRALKVSAIDASEQFTNPSYERYASFVVNNESLINALDTVGKDQEKKIITYSDAGDYFSKDSHNCVSYVTKIMKNIGIDINFGWSMRSPENLKKLVDSYENSGSISMIKKENLPRYPYQ